MAKSNSPKNYGNDSISSLKGADRVRKRPAVIFGSDGLEGCEHAVFEILSNAIDEAREGHGSLITVTRYEDHSIEVEDFGRGCPVDWNEKEQKFNWELVFCELYAGGKYNNNDGDNYEYSLGLNGLGSCATQYASAYFDAVIHRDGFEYTLHFEKGENVGGLKKEPYSGKKTGSRFRWKPDLDVFTDINIPVEYYTDVLKRQAVVNAGVTFRFRNQVGGKFETTDFQYENGIEDYVKELAGENSLTLPVFWQTERKGRDRADKPEYKVKLSVSFCFSNTVQIIEHYHNSSWLEHGGSPEKAVKSAFVNGIDAYLKAQGKYQKSESKITWADVEDCLVLVSNNFSTQTSYENQTKKAINNKFVQEAMTEFLRAQLEVYFIENPLDSREDRRAGAHQQAQPRDGRACPHHGQKEALRQPRYRQPRAEIRRLPQPRRQPPRAVYRRGRFRHGLGQALARRGVSGHHAHPRQNSQLPEGGLCPHFQE